MRLLSFILALLIISFSNKLYCQDTLTVQNVQAILYKGNGTAQPLVVGLGGSEGGNAWASNYWKKTRDAFIDKGYAFLALGYFGAKGTPALLDQIAIDQVYKAISIARAQPGINSKKIAIIGGSRGADLALLLGSYYNDINCVIGMSSSHAVFPGHTQTFTSSSFTFEGKELPFIPVNEAAVPFMMKRDLRKSFEAMLQDTLAEKKSLIAVEKIHGPILLLAADKDEIIPAVYMAEKMMHRLKTNHFGYPYELVIVDGSHASTTRQFDKIFVFLAKHF